MKKVSELLAELSEKTKELENKTKDYEQNVKADYQTWATNVEARAKEEEQAFSNRIDKLSNDAKGYWENVKSNYTNEVAKAKDKYQQWKQDIKVKDAQWSANVAEENAEASIYYAMVAIANAEEAVAKAVETRLKADNIQ